MGEPWYNRFTCDKYYESNENIDQRFAKTAFHELSKLLDAPLLGKHFRLLTNGSDGHTYLVTTNKGEQVLRIWKRKPYDEVEYEQCLLIFLEQNAFPAARPFVAIKKYFIGGQQIITALRPASPGVHTDKIGIKKMQKIAGLVAQFHLLTEGKRFSGKIDRFTLSDLSFLKSLNLEEPLLQKGAHQVTNTLKNIQWGGFKQAVVHDDLKPPNIITDDSGGIHIIDWSDAHVDYCVADIAGLVLEYELSPLQAKILVETYNEERSLSFAEIEVLPSLVIRRALFMLWYVELCLKAIKNEEERQRFVKARMWLMDNLRRLLNEN